MAWYPGKTRYFLRAAAPTVNDDENDDYRVSDIWIDETNDKVYFCLDATAGAAVWVEVAVVANVLPKTGQTTSYADYDDGYYEKGWDEGDRFTDNEDGTITDNATGLMWPKDLEGAATNSGAIVVWLAAINFAEALDFAGHQDWRVPNWLELISIGDHSAYSPAIYDIFDNAAGKIIWSSSSNPYTTSQALLLDVNSLGRYSWDKTWEAGIVLPVRTA